MNKMTSYEWEGYKADFWVAVIAFLFLISVAAWKISTGDLGPLLENNPCAGKGYSVWVDGEFIGCTGDGPSGETWRPTLRNDND